MFLSSTKCINSNTIYFIYLVNLQKSVRWYNCGIRLLNVTSFPGSFVDLEEIINGCLASLDSMFHFLKNKTLTKKFILMLDIVKYLNL